VRADGHLSFVQIDTRPDIDTISIDVEDTYPFSIVPEKFKDNNI
jgi:hypothetical protein